jgi:hypothetical protein
LIPSGNLSLENERFIAGYMSHLCGAKNFFTLKIVIGVLAANVPWSSRVSQFGSHDHVDETTYPDHGSQIGAVSAGRLPYEFSRLDNRYSPFSAEFGWRLSSIRLFGGRVTRNVRSESDQGPLTVSLAVRCTRGPTHSKLRLQSHPQAQLYRLRLHL